MIKKLKTKFIILSTTSLLIVLTLIIAVMNIINYSNTVADADEVLEFLSDNKGTFPNFEKLPDEDMKWDKNDGRLPHYMSPELPYESRFFSVLIDENGKMVYCDVSRIASVDKKTAEQYALEVNDLERERGFINKIRFFKSSEGKFTRIVFLDCGSKLQSVGFFLFTSSMISLVAFVIVGIVLFFLSNRIIRPISESYEKQKRFITDAGHEIKTPLTIINANVDVLEMDIGKNESLEDIKKQSTRLTNLTNQLVFLSKMEESKTLGTKTGFEISSTVEELADSFGVLAASQNKSLKLEADRGLFIHGDEIAIGQLVSILLENSVKYSPEGAEISVKLTQQNKWIHLTVENPSSYYIDPEKLEHVFERFYKIDESRNSSVGGHGIGLSLARAITEANNGKIGAELKDGNRFKITVSFLHI